MVNNCNGIESMENLKISNKTRFVLYCVVLGSSLFLFPSCSSDANHSEDKGFLKQVLSLFTSSKDKMKQQKDVYQDGSSVGPKEVADLVMRAKKAGRTVRIYSN